MCPKLFKLIKSICQLQKNRRAAPSVSGHTWVRVASNSLQASLLGVDSGSPASFHAYTQQGGIIRTLFHGVFPS